MTMGVLLKHQLILLILILGLLGLVHGACTMMKQCGTNPEYPGRKVNCLYRGEPQPFKTEEGLKKFRENCPSFYEGPDTRVCCSDQQILTLDSQVDVPRQALFRCPSCFRNFFNLWCHFTCSANQSEFTNANVTKPFKLPDNTTAQQVLTIDYSVSRNFAYGMFNSCRYVQSPSLNEPALSLLCGQKAELCTPEQWLSFMGDPSNGQAPFAISFHVTDDDIVYNSTGTEYVNKPMNVTSFPCNKAPSEDSEPCSCQDCKDSCAKIPPMPPPEKPCEILHIGCYDFAFSAVFAAFLLIFGCYSICYNIIVQDSLRLEEPGQDNDSCCGWRFGKGLAANRNARKKEYLESMSKDQLSYMERIGARMERFLEKIFTRWGLVCTTHPIKMIVISLIITGVLCAGIALFQVTTNPVKLWSGPNSRARLEKEYFDSHFVPFYRSEQIIISSEFDKNHAVSYQPDPFTTATFSNMFQLEFMHQMLDLQLAIEDLEAEYDNKTIRLEDICFAPLKPDNNNCTIQSIFNYFQNRHELLDKVVEEGWDIANYLSHFMYCTTSPTSINDTNKFGEPCLGTFGGPVLPWVALGGFNDTGYNSSAAFVITFVVNNHLDEDKNKEAEAWEAKYIEFMKEYAAEYKARYPNVSISFSAERSIEDEIDRQSASDVFTILISYLTMFAYITVMLGRYESLSRIQVNSKVVLGIGGVVLVLMSVGASLGFYSYLGIPSTLIIVEVVPFLVLAVGVDNIFILVQTYQREERLDGETTDHLMARVLGKVGPSMLLTSFSESLAFFLGALTQMPAVKVFSLYAAMAVMFDFLLQITCFTSLVYLDAKREEADRVDMLCCLTTPARRKKRGNGLLYTFVSKYYAHFLMKEWVRPVVMVIFVGWCCISAALTSRVSIGLDQSLSMPKDSYVLDYFHNLTAYLSVGAPVYFVVRDGHDYSTYEGQNDICGVSGCPQDSLVQQVYTAALRPNLTYVAQPVSSWLDDYFAWIISSPCCRYDNVTGDFCPSSEVNSNCVACVLNSTKQGRPVDTDFYKYLPWFLEDNPNIKCAKGGHAAYGSGVELYNNSLHETRVGATYFMTYHSILKTSADYINALKEARSVADNITKSLNESGSSLEVFPYSVFYVFYEQYLDITEVAFHNILYCLLAIFVISVILLGIDIYAALVVVFTISMIVVDMLGMMYLWDIELNALSLVNIIMAIGISVEFCSHIIRAFTVSILPTRKERAKDALGHMGSSVLSGITLTKLGGIIVLGFSKSQLFQVFYFRMYLGMVIFGATHGLIFLPVLLSYLGPPVNKAKVFHHRIKQAELEVAEPNPYAASQQSYQNGSRAGVQGRYSYDNPPQYGTIVHHSGGGDQIS